MAMKPRKAKSDIKLRKSSTPRPKASSSTPTPIKMEKDETDGQAYARAFTSPFVMPGFALQAVQKPIGIDEASHADYVTAMVKAGEKVKAGKMGDV